ncbi:MAG TPA: DEAD/DEAH box helicase [Massilibacterium sp.]|nr:DEAD/DEAH box helicase [Massilibacterium sp.]
MEQKNIEMKLSKKQQEFYDLALRGKNVFLSGKAGTGKSFVSKLVINELAKKKNIAVVAPTGVAATNIGGATMHSTFSLPIYGVMEFQNCNFLRSEKRAVINSIDTLLIDEISMVRPDMLDGIHLTMKKNGCRGLDEIQVIVVGDMKQLQPVMDDNFKSMLLKKYQGLDFTYSNIFKKLNFSTIELDEVLRQSDNEFITHLNVVRDGGKSNYFRKFLANETKGIVLAPHNSTVKKYNKKGLDAQSGELFTYDAHIEGKCKETDFNFESRLEVKDGCKIMYLVNSKNNQLVNGTIGTFRKRGDNLFIEVGGEQFAIDRFKSEKKEYVYNEQTEKIELQEVGSMTQYPIKLAYAVSIHKSQGMTFDEVTLDLSMPCFAEGQLYVGLSRVTSPSGLTIIVNR